MPNFIDLNDRITDMDTDVEPIRHAPSARIRLLKMYREDVNELLAMFERACKTVVISDEKHRYKTLDAMQRTVSSPIKELTIRGSDPDVVFLFNRTELVSGASGPTQTIYNELRTDISSDTADALFYKVKDFLLQYQRPTVRKGFLACAAVSLGGIFWVAEHYAITDSRGEQKLAPQGLLPLLVSMLVVAILVGLSFGGRNYVTLEKRRDAPSFFVRNREEFAARALGTGIASLISGLCGYLLGHYLK
jgi:hypothetical protein